ncbi:hypothetical protein [Arthrobacter rhombi]|uniref:Methionine synthase, vitamin-B12 independent, putative n=1 Tax=Arthrobacter rhombi TaxID=71253 RepID=A0A1R4GMC9_9MICC|nr:hypothetical protein [Arthrobacter rhombi]SJM69235.1 Methionine synthase, vitamin-B12 independent, putative [Arthrobacter rhombi]
MPGTDPLESTRIIRGELGAPHLPHLIQLPDRGVGSDALGRTASLLTELYVDVQPHGWRLTDRPGRDYRRAVSALGTDLGVLGDVIGTAGNAPGALKVQLRGPLSLSAGISLHHGEKILSDVGARRDLADSLADGAVKHVHDVQRVTGATPLTVVVEEPEAAAVLGGAVPTASGYRNLRAVDRQEAAKHWKGLVQGLREAGAETVVLAPGTGFPAGGPSWPELITDSLAAGFDTVCLDGQRAELAAWERCAELVDQGGQLWLETLNPEQELLGVKAAVQAVHRRFRMLGLPDALLGAVTLMPAPGLETTTPETTRRVLRRITQTAEALDQVRLGG